MQDDMSSMKLSRWEMPPWSSSPGSPLARRAAARCRSRPSMGLSRRATTNEANRGESGHPWLVPSSMRRRRHDPSFHL